MGEPAAGNAIGDPIDTATGNVYRHETDLVLGRWLRWERTYNSDAHADTAGPLGPRWRYTYRRHLTYLPAPIGRTPVLRYTHDDGRVWRFTRRLDGRWIVPADLPVELVAGGSDDAITGWTFRFGNS